MKIRDLANRVDFVTSGAVGDVLYRRFETDPDALLIAVLDADHRPVGLVERNAFLVRLARDYGRALYAQRPIDLLMDKEPMIVEGETLAADFTARMISGRPSDLLRGFIVVDDGRYVGVGTSLSLLQAASMERAIYAAEMRELAENLEVARREAEQNRIFTEAVIEHIPSMVWVKSAQDGRYLMINRAGEKVLGVDRQSFVGKRGCDFFGDETATALNDEDRRLIENGGVSEFEGLQYIRKSDGEERVLHLKKIAIAGDDLGVKYILGVGEDITQRRTSEARIERLALFDEMTDLPNRVQFQTHLEAALDRCRATDAIATVLVVDLDRFKLVNDTLGHAAGDDLLRKVAARMRSCVRSGDLIARLGGDEFAIVQTDLTDLNQARQVAERIVRTLAEPFGLGGHVARIGASVGIAAYPNDALTAEELLKKADIALYRVKSEGRGAWLFFEPDMDEMIQARRILEIELRDAVQNGDFEAHYQPLYNVEQHRITGFEALMRWRHADRGWVPPSEFIPVAEDLQLIRPLGEWMLRESCEAAASWPEPVSVAVNISPVQLHGGGFVSMVTQALANSGLPPERLELEITESVLLEDDPEVLASLHQLRALGVRLSLDDFGTGYASLGYLRRLPLDKIKIDQTFIRGLPDAADSVAIVGAVVRLARDLGMSVTAEGVETEAQLDMLVQLGCGQVQGYLIGRPDNNPVARLIADVADRLVYRSA